MAISESELAAATGAPAAVPVRVFQRPWPGTTPQEIVVLLAGALGVTAAAVALAAVRAPGWSALQWASAVAVAFDFGGGLAGNATAAAKRWYHRPGRVRARLLFYALHLHPFLVAWAFAFPWGQAAALYAGMLAAAALVEVAPRPLAQPVALGAVAVAVAAAGAGTWPAGLEWFAPVYLLKLVGAHAVPPQG